MSEHDGQGQAADIRSQGNSTEQAHRLAALLASRPVRVRIEVPPSDATVRAWCQSHGYPVSDRGRVSSGSRAAWDAAHGN